jgi:hypothetical protein
MEICWNKNFLNNSVYPVENTVLLVDLDFTLVKCNTTFDFLNRFFHFRYIIFSRLLFPLIFINSCFKRDFYKKFIVFFCIRGARIDALKSYSDLYFNFIELNFDQYFNKKIIQMLDSSTTKKILLTSSLDLIAQNFEKLGFDAVVSSPTYEKNGRFYGFRDLYARKHSFVLNLSLDFDKLIIIDDCPEPEFNSIRGAKVIRVA